MAQPDRAAKPYFSHPIRQIFSMTTIIGLVGVGAYVAYPRVAPVFLANPYLNGFILLVFVVGVYACFWQTFQIAGSVRWILVYARGDAEHGPGNAPRLLASMAALLGQRGAQMRIGATSARSILDSVAQRIDEARDFTRYVTNLLIFLGLLGTFYGLATTVPAVVDTIRSLAPQGDEAGIEVFNRLMTGLETQLGGMGVAFSSSLLGLAGSLVVGLLELFASRGQNRFYRELEDWLSTITRLVLSGSDGEPDADRSSVAAGLDRMAELLSDQVAALKSIADRQDRLIEELERSRTADARQTDAESRMRLRSIDVQILRILEEMSAGREFVVTSLRSDIIDLIKAVRALTPPEGDKKGKPWR